MISPFVLFSILLVFGVNATETIADSDNITIIDQQESSSISSKRLWFNITNDVFLKDLTHLEIEWKNDSAFGSTNSKTLNTLKNYNGGTYYYVDVPIKCESIRICSKNSDNAIMSSTKWKTNLYPARLYEVFNHSNILRFRSADVFPPDAYVLSSFLSNYYSCSSSYENGYSAYPDIERYWLVNYAGNVKGSLETTYFYDYPLSQNQREDLNKTRLISAKDKLDELKNLSLNNPLKKRNSNLKVLFIGLALFIITFGLSLVICFLMIKQAKRKGGAMYDFE